MLTNLRYHLAMLIFKFEKRFRITTYFFFPFRLITRIYEILNFKNIKENKNIEAFSNYFLDISKISDDTNLSIISGGVAFNTFFEEKIQEKFKIKNLVLIDPNKDSKNYALDRLNNASFENKALSDKDEKNIKIFLPPSKKEVNISLDNTFDTKHYEYVDTVTIDYIKKKYNLQNIDILKLDVEGVADIIIIDCLKKKIFPTQICFELERPYAFNRQIEFLKRINTLTNQLRKYYDIYNYTDQKKGIRVELLAIIKTEHK